ncbi:MAG: prepilin-type N-terminal cleavage/methylation domain-containing protein [Elusimicrobiota bacterium]|nr:prepilin-type N-terminal cleavage/methylation domain-containing protein [Elusimicrobiota bacterium]
MKIRKGFTLAELVLSVLIFSFMAASLATIVSTTNRHMFQNYRTNIIKTNVLISMKSIQNKLSVATRVDLPAVGTGDTRLAFATNVDQNTGCYPVYAAAAQPAWHYFCQAGSKLYHYTGPINGGVSACGTAAPTIWCSNNPVASGCYGVAACGGGSGTLLMEDVLPTLPGGALFSRRAADGINEVDTVRVLLRSRWIPSAPGRGLGAAQREVDTTLDTVIRFNRSRN